MRRILLQLVLPAVLLVVLGSLVKHKVFFDRTKVLREAALGADRVVVQDLNFHGKGARPDCEISGADKVRELFQLIVIESDSAPCMCGGEFRMHVFQGERELVDLGYHHGHALRWHNGRWYVDGWLTDAAQQAVPAWFQKNGCSYFQELIDERRAEKERRNAEYQRFVTFFPEPLRGLFDLGYGSVSDKVEPRGRQLAEAMADGEATALAVCRALGSLPPDWSVVDIKEQVALAAVRQVDGRQFLSALRKLGDDRAGLRGAARVFFDDGFDERYRREGFHKKVPSEVRTEWMVRLARIVFTDDRGGDKVTLLRFLGDEHNPEVRTLLRDVFRGRVGKEINRTKDSDEEPGLRTGAALSLALLGDASIKAEVEAMLRQVKEPADVAALELCLALLGDPTYLKVEHFRLRSFTIGLVGLKAIERYQGKHGMEALVRGALQHPFGLVSDKACQTFQRD
jgi:hypothetical protein